MDISTKKDLIKGIYQHWISQYPISRYNANSEYSGDRDKFTIGENLKNLKPKTTKQIDEIIGNSSWTTHECDECKINYDTLIWLGFDDDCDEPTGVKICLTCLKKAIILAAKK